MIFFFRLVCGLVTTSCFIGFVVSPYVVEAVTVQSWSMMWTICGCLFAVSWLIYLPIRFEEQPKQKENAKMKKIQTASPLIATLAKI